MGSVEYRVRVFLFIAGLIVGGVVATGGTEGVQAARPGETLDAAVRRNIAHILLKHRNAIVSSPQREVRWVNGPDGNLGISQAMENQAPYRQELYFY